MWWWLLGGTSALFFALLLVPITLDLHLDASDRSAVVRWAFGLVKLDLLARHPKAQSAADARDAQHGRRGHRAARSAMRALRIEGLWRCLDRLARRLLRATHPRNARFAVRIGLGDPAATGILWGAVAPVAMDLPAWTSDRLHLELDFIDTCFELRGRGHFTVVPAELLLVSVGFAFSPPVVRGLMSAWRA